MNDQLTFAIVDDPTAHVPVDAGTAAKPSAGKRPDAATVEQRQLAVEILSGDPGASHRSRITPPGSGLEERKMPSAPEAPTEEVVGPPLEFLDPEQPDDLWLASLPLMDQVADPGLFKAEALLYRRTTKARIAYLKATKGLLPAKGLAGRGRLQFALAGPHRIKHPRDWKRCGTCLGKGGDCKGCRGGYVTI